jgi:SAM-dependent methyltransferase
MTMLDDPELVGSEYASEARLEQRRAAYQWSEGPDPREVAFAAVAEVSPRRILEVGCGPGELAERLAAELRAEVVAVDVSPRMVELARQRGVDARLGDVQKLPFADGEFECAVAAWMLYHVRDLDLGVSELRRVLAPAGRLVAVTNGLDHMRELSDLLGGTRLMEVASFRCDNGADVLARHFGRVERRDADGWVVFPDRRAAQAYVDATVVLSQGGRQLRPLDGPVRVRRAPCVFVAEA